MQLDAQTTSRTTWVMNEGKAYIPRRPRSRPATWHRVARGQARGFCIDGKRCRQLARVDDTAMQAAVRRSRSEVPRPTGGEIWLFGGTRAATPAGQRQ
jgi:hypothetical protein